MSTRKNRRLIVCIVMFSLVTLSCSVLENFRSYLCEKTGGDWVTVDETTYYCDRNRGEQQPVDPGDQSASTQRTDEEYPYGMTLLGDWYGDKCIDSDVGTFAYNWSVNLFINEKTGKIAGTLKFHNCPGGGKVLYVVTGLENNDGILSLNAIKKTGGGELYNNSPDSKIFYFDPSEGIFTP